MVRFTLRDVLSGHGELSLRVTDVTLNLGGNFVEMAAQKVTIFPHHSLMPRYSVNPPRVVLDNGDPEDTWKHLNNGKFHKELKELEETDGGKLPRLYWLRALQVIVLAGVRVSIAPYDPFSTATPLQLVALAAASDTDLHEQTIRKLMLAAKDATFKASTCVTIERFNAFMQQKRAWDMAESEQTMECGGAKAMLGKILENVTNSLHMVTEQLKQSNSERRTLLTRLETSEHNNQKLQEQYNELHMRLVDIELSQSSKQSSLPTWVHNKRIRFVCREGAGDPRSMAATREGTRQSTPE